MVALKQAQITQLLEQPGSTYSAVLLHGTDAGLISERSSQLAQRFSENQREPSEILRLDDDDLAQDPDRPIVELRTIPMFGGPKVVRIKAGPRLRPAIFEDLLAPGLVQGFLIVEAGNLKRDSKLKKLFDGSKTAASLACYSDDTRSIERMIDEVIAEHGLKLTKEARGHLTGLLGADRALSRAEVEKLALYGIGRHELTSDDVDAIVGDATEQALDKVVSAALCGNAARAFAELDRVNSGGQPPQSVMLALQRHLARLHRARVEIDTGKSPEIAVKTLRPPVHFKEVATFQAQCRDWTVVALERASARTQKVIERIRRTPALELQLTGQLLLGLAQHAQNSARARRR